MPQGFYNKRVSVTEGQDYKQVIGQASKHRDSNRVSTLQMDYFYCPKTKLVKVMFLHLSASHSVQGGDLQALTEGGGLGGLRATPGGEVGGSGWWGVQAHTRGGGSRPQAHMGGGGVKAQARGVDPSMHWGSRHPPADGYCCGWYASY